MNYCCWELNTNVTFCIFWNHLEKRDHINEENSGRQIGSHIQQVTSIATHMISIWSKCARVIHRWPGICRVVYYWCITLKRRQSLCWTWIGIPLFPLHLKNRRMILILFLNGQIEELRDWDGVVVSFLLSPSILRSVSVCGSYQGTCHESSGYQ